MADHGGNDLRVFHWVDASYLQGKGHLIARQIHHRASVRVIVIHRVLNDSSHRALRAQPGHRRAVPAQLCQDGVGMLPQRRDRVHADGVGVIHAATCRQ